MNTKRIVITEYGVVSDPEKLQTELIQNCINLCKENGGGTVVIPAGKYVVGSLRLYSNITLYLESGAILMGSNNYEDYEDYHVPTTIKYLYDEYYIKQWNLPPYYFYGIITAFQEKNVSIIAESGAIIDGHDTFDANGEEKFRGPMGIIMSQVDNLKLSGYIFQNSANWSHVLDGCKNIKIDNVITRAGHDGFNLHHSEDIQINNCIFETGDDCLAGYDIQNLYVNNCYLNTACNVMRIGGENILLENCVLNGPGRFPHLSKKTFYTHAIFKYYAIDADEISSDGENIILRDCLINDADKLITYDYGNKTVMQNNRPLRDLKIENVKIKDIHSTSILKGNGEKIHLILKNVQIDFLNEKNSAFIEIDKSVFLEFQDVVFKNPTKISVVDGAEMIFQGNVNFKWNEN